MLPRYVLFTFTEWYAQVSGSIRQKEVKDEYIIVETEKHRQKDVHMA
jgi:hypothetical protein